MCNVLTQTLSTLCIIIITMERNVSSILIITNQAISICNDNRISAIPNIVASSIFLNTTATVWAQTMVLLVFLQPLHNRLIGWNTIYVYICFKNSENICNACLKMIYINTCCKTQPNLSKSDYCMVAQHGPKIPGQTRIPGWLKCFLWMCVSMHKCDISTHIILL